MEDDEEKKRIKAEAAGIEREEEDEEKEEEEDDLRLITDPRGLAAAPREGDELERGSGRIRSISGRS